MKKIFILSLTAIIFISFAGFSQNIDSERLDAYFETLFEHNRFMGSVAVARGGELIYSKSVGFADVEQGIKIDENTKFRIGSITKTFTAVLILKAVEKNRLTLCQTIDKWFPEIGNADKITIEHLLRHRSGLYEIITGEWESSGRHIQPKTEQEVIEIIKKGENNFEPGTKTIYNNAGFLLLTFILERVYDKPFSEILKEKIVNPTGLKNTYLGGKINIQNNEAYSYSFLHQDWIRKCEANISQLLGAGGIISTSMDLIKFSHALFSGKLLSERSLKQMQTIQEHCQITELVFGMGLMQIPFHYRIGLGHGGGIDEFSALFAYFSDGDVSIAFSSNSRHFNLSLNDIATVLLSAAYNKPFEIPEFTIFDATDVDLSQFVGVYESPEIAWKFSITNENNQLFWQTTGQSSFPLEMIGENKFKFRPSDAVLEFNPADSTMILRHSDKKFRFTLYNPLNSFDASDVDLNQFVGIYASASASVQWQITITNVDNQLFGQVTGQSSFPLRMTGENKFELRPAGLILEFNPTDNTMIFRHDGYVLNFERE
jgi:CubicO group peptidase (beta-lactamase class C family)